MRGDRLLFRRLSLDLGPSQGCHVTGANGAGKTTLLRTVAGLSAPFAGDVRCAGSVGLMDERSALEPDMTLGRALGFWFALDRTRERASVLDRLRLTQLVDVPVRYLSTGQTKRAGIARLLGQGAQIWLLDEPLSGLDTASQDMVSALISEHLGTGGIALIASHQPLAVPGLITLAIEDFIAPHQSLSKTGDLGETGA